MPELEGINKNYAVEYQKVIDAKFAPQRYSNDLWNSPLNSQIKWDGLHVKIPMLTVDGGSSYRTTGGDFSDKYADVSNDYEDMKIGFARKWKAKVDPVDVIGTSAVVAMANITQLHNDATVEEDDAYMFSKLYKEKERINGIKGTAGHGIKSDVQLDESNILDVIDEISDEMDESKVRGQKVLYVTPRVKRLINKADVTNRHANISGNGVLDRDITSIDDIVIKKVPSYLMKTNFDFTHGVRDINGAKQIDMFMIVNGIQAAPKRYSWAGLQSQSALTDGQIVYYEMRLEDVFMLQNKADAYAAVVSSQRKDVTNNATEQPAQQPAQQPAKDEKADDAGKDTKK